MQNPDKSSQELHFRQECDEDHNHCDHECTMYQLPDETEPRIVCSCFSGYILDENDGITCVGE